MKFSDISILLLIVVSCLSLNSFGQSIHDVKTVAGSTNNQLEVLDWGGKGQPILFLTGLSNTAHVYDGFAARFTNSFHVFGLSRRGYGGSEQTSSGYGIDTLTSDILSVINALAIDKVILIGHSLAGDEMTLFASKYPERILKVVYLDAAYDHSNIGLPFPGFPKGMAKDSLSVQDLNEDLKKIRGFMFPEEELRHQYVFSPQGYRNGAVTPAQVASAIVKGLRLQDYRGMKCPALAIYGQRSTAAQYFPSYKYMDSAQQNKAVTEFMPAWKTYYNAEIERFKNERTDGIVEEIPGADHYVFLTHPNETERIMREFLK